MTSYPTRLCGDYYGDQAPWECEDCGGSEYSCDCDDTPDALVCFTCEAPLDANSYCSGCDEHVLVEVERISPTQVLL